MTILKNKFRHYICGIVFSIEHLVSSIIQKRFYFPWNKDKVIMTAGDYYDKYSKYKYDDKKKEWVLK